MINKFDIDTFDLIFIFINVQTFISYDYIFIFPGQLKVSAYMNFGLLTVHVVQGRQLTTKWKPSCDSFVKVSCGSCYSKSIS